MHQRQRKTVDDSFMRKLITVIFVLFVILIPVFAVPVNLYSAPDGNIQNGFSLLNGLFSDQSPLAEGFFYWKKEYPSIKDWFESKPGTLSRLHYYEKLATDRSKEVINLAVATAGHLSPPNVTPLSNVQSSPIDRVDSAESFQLAEAPASPVSSPDKFNRWSILKTNYILLTFGLIGYLIIRRRANI
jgi:hypothetical protein